MLNGIMLYKHPGKHAIHGDKFDYIVVPIEGHEKYLDEGWYLTTAEAKADSKIIKKITNDLIPPSEIDAGLKQQILEAEGTHKNVAAQYNVSATSVYRIKNGKL